MAFGILRIRNLKPGMLSNCEQHNRRLYKETSLPPNIDFSRIDQNLSWIKDDQPSYAAALDRCLESVSVRKNSVVAIEFVMAASKEFYSGNYSAVGFLSNCVKFLADKYGWDNILSIDQHHDESNPHVHVLIVPVVEKRVKWKNSKGYGEKIEKRLCARDITGGPEKLRLLQEEFFRFIQPYGEVAGVPFYRGTLAEHQVREYTKRTDHRLAKISKIMDSIRKETSQSKKEELQMMAVSEEVNLKKDQEEIKKLELKISTSKRRNSQGGWKKGFNPWS